MIWETHDMPAPPPMKGEDLLFAALVIVGSWALVLWLITLAARWF